VVGYITSAAYGHTLGGAVGLGYVACAESGDAEKMLAAEYEIIVAGQRIPADAALDPFYNPANSHMRA
jgi:4-methylaminobutanoate oxidase (formaldehyde-forming)